jgi:AhpD family alkylhydroperoxidase
LIFLAALEKLKNRRRRSGDLPDLLLILELTGNIVFSTIQSYAGVRMAESLDEFRSYRQQMNDRILELDHLVIKRFFNLDTMCYNDGALTGRTKEILGLVASAVLRCNDCIDYHLIQCVKAGFTDEELFDALNVALVVGGSIVIPHMRHAVDSIDQLRAEQKKKA